MWDRTEIEVELTLIRHGATASNLEHRYLGRTDEPLCTEGVRMLERYQREGRYRKSGGYRAEDALFTGPMLRCRQTAAILFPECEPVCIPEWTEMDFGRFEGKNYEELNGDPDYQAWIDSGGTIPFPGGESRTALQERTARGFHRMMDHVAGQAVCRAAGQVAYRTAGQRTQEREKRRIVAVVHGGTVMALLSALFGEEYFAHQPKCGEGYLCRFLYSEQTIKLLELKKQC